MTRIFSVLEGFNFLIILLLCLACSETKKPEAPQEMANPKLIKTIGAPNYGSVKCGLQDKAGNLWFGTTENGLYKYDGKSFQQLLLADGLISNSISSLLEDSTGKIWIGTDKGLCLYDGKSITYIEIPLPKNQPPNTNELYRNSQMIFSMIQAKNGVLWIATINGVFTYDGTSFSPFQIKANSGGFLSTNHNVEKILEDKEGNFWFGGRGNEGVYRYDGKSVTQLELEVLYQDGPTPKPTAWAWPQLQDKDGTIWFSNWGGAYRYDGKSFRGFTKKDGLRGGVGHIVEDQKGNLWFGGDAGAGLSKYDGATFTIFTKEDGLIHNSIWSILEDKAGNLWIGTRETGLSRFDGKTFQTYSEYKQASPTDLKEDNIK